MRSVMMSDTIDDKIKDIQRNADKIGDIANSIKNQQLMTMEKSIAVYTLSSLITDIKIIQRELHSGYSNSLDKQQLLNELIAQRNSLRKRLHPIRWYCYWRWF